MKNVLMVTFQYPPFHGSSAVNRTLHFTRQLGEWNWRPTVLTVAPRAYRQVSEERLTSIPRDVVVERTFGLDAARHLSVRGYRPFWLSLPDPWWSWWLSAVPRGLSLVRKTRTDVISSTFPIATTHLIAWTLHRLTGLPLVVDFRDPMTEDEYVGARLTWTLYRWIERQCITRCVRAVFTTQGARGDYLRRYPHLGEEKFVLIPNGYSEEDFVIAEAMKVEPKTERPPLLLLHSGALYPSERDPRALFAALGNLLRASSIKRGDVKLVLRGTGFDGYHRKLIAEHGVESVVSLEPSLPYHEALAEVIHADALLVIQASSCNRQVPAKVYEYLRSRRPILALTDPAGDTATVLRDAGVDSIVPLDSMEKIAEFLPAFLEDCRRGVAPRGSEKAIGGHSRRERARVLAGVLDAALRRDEDEPG